MYIHVGIILSFSVGRSKDQIAFNYRVFFSGERTGIISLQKKNTFRDLTEKICQKEGQPNCSAYLFLPNGIPLNANETTEKWSLEEWNFQSDCLVLVVFGTKCEVDPEFVLDEGDDVLTKGDTRLLVHGLKSGEIFADLESDTHRSLYQRVSSATKIPINCLKLSSNGCFIENSPAKRLSDSTELGIQANSDISIEYSPVFRYNDWYSLFKAERYDFKVDQTEEGKSVFLSTLFVLAHYITKENHDLKVLKLIMELTVCPPLVLALAMLFDRRVISRAQRVVIVTGLYYLFRSIIPSDKCMAFYAEDKNVFEFSHDCWSYLITEAVNSNKDGLPRHYDHYISFFCNDCGRSFSKPFCVKGDKVCCQACSLRYGQNSPLLVSANVAQLMVALPGEKSASYWDLVKDYKDWPRPDPPKVTRSSSRPKYLMVLTPAYLKRNLSDLPPRLVYDEKKRVVVYIKNSKQIDKGRALQVFDPLQGKVRDDPVLLSEIEYKHQKMLFPNIEDFAKNWYITEAPDEAVVVLLDISGSMVWKNRLHIAKQAFLHFANQSMKYNFNQAIGLTLFKEKVLPKCQLTEAVQSFKQLLEDDISNWKVSRFGDTALYDAIIAVIVQLKEATLPYPECAKRILCLTDGNDKCSGATLEECLKKIVSENVTLDCILLSNKNESAKKLALASNGYAFFVKEEEQCKNIFEREAVLFSPQRRKLPERSYTVDLDFAEELKIKEPQSLTSKACNPSKMFAMYWNGPQPVGKANKVNQINPNCLKNILKDLNICLNHQDFQGNFKIFPIEEDPTLWWLLLAFAQNHDHDSPKQNYLFYVQFPKDYPYAPPMIRLKTPVMLSCKFVSKDGYIFAPELRADYYSSKPTMVDIMMAILKMFREQPILDRAEMQDAATSKSFDEDYHVKLTEIGIANVDQSVPQFIDETWFM